MLLFLYTYIYKIELHLLIIFTTKLKLVPLHSLPSWRVNKSHFSLSVWTWRTEKSSGLQRLLFSAAIWEGWPSFQEWMREEMKRIFKYIIHVNDSLKSRSSLISFSFRQSCHYNAADKLSNHVAGSIWMSVCMNTSRRRGEGGGHITGCNAVFSSGNVLF